MVETMRPVDISFILLPNPRLSNPTMYVSLGVLYLVSILRKHNYNVSVVDMRDEEPDVNLIPPCKFVAFSATTGEMGFATKLSEQLDATTIIGGAHASLFPESCIGSFDYIVVGEGEEVIPDIISGFHSGIIVAPRIKNLDRIPFPAWNSIPQNKLFSHNLFTGEKYGYGKEAGTIIGSRGCPFKCSFCANVMNTPVVFRSPESIGEELLSLKEYYGINHFRFEDDNITLNKRWLAEVCSITKELNIKWKCHTRADLVDSETMELMQDSGCEEVGLGIESADDDVLRLVNKDITSAQSFNAVKTIQGAGMRAKIYLMMGLPGETENTVKITKEFIEHASPDKWTLARFTPYPGCDVWNNPDNYGINIISNNFENYWNFPYNSVHELDSASVEILNNRYERMYQWLTNRLLLTRSWTIQDK